MYNELLEQLKDYLLNRKYTSQEEEVMAFRLKSLIEGENLTEELKQIVLKVDNLYNKNKLIARVRNDSLIGLISYLTKTNNSKKYSIKSLSFFLYFFGDYDEKELDKFIKNSPSSKTLKLLKEKSDTFFEGEYYLNYYDDFNRLEYDLLHNNQEQMREMTGFYRVPNYDEGGYINEGRRI